MSADLALIASAALMGLTGAPHCAAMCSAPCAGVLRACDSPGPVGAAMGGLMAARIVSYAAGGAIAAGAVAGLQALGAAAPALRIFWTLLHVAALGLGLWLLATGRQPAWWSRLGKVHLPTPATATATATAAGTATGTATATGTSTAMVPFGALRQRLPGPARASLIGAAWVLLPCGLLQSALVVAGLASGPAAGAATMAAFAIASAPGLVALPLWLRRGGRGTPAWSLRAAGALLAAASLFALGHGLWLRIAAYCFN
jgi:sulfite exporter TauE/SafE